jgi:hypothetical protein
MEIKDVFDKGCLLLIRQYVSCQIWDYNYLEEQVLFDNRDLLDLSVSFMYSTLMD